MLKLFTKNWFQLVQSTILFGSLYEYRKQNLNLLHQNKTFSNQLELDMNIKLLNHYKEFQHKPFQDVKKESVDPRKYFEKDELTIEKRIEQLYNDLEKSLPLSKDVNNINIIKYLFEFNNFLHTSSSPVNKNKEYLYQFPHDSHKMVYSINLFHDHLKYKKMNFKDYKKYGYDNNFEIGAQSIKDNELRNFTLKYQTFLKNKYFC